MVILKHYAFLFLLCIQGTESFYAGGIHRYMKTKIVNLIGELTKHAIVNVRRVQHFLDLYIMDDAFFIGKLMYVIRKKYSRMVRLYMLSYNNFDEYDQNKHILHLVEIQHIAMEIDNLVEVILDYLWPTKKRKKPYEKALRPDEMKYAEEEGVSLPAEVMGALRMRHTTRKLLYENQYKDLDKSIVIRNIAGKKLVEGKNLENNGGGFDSDVNY